MRILFDIYHPAQVHLFKNLIIYLLDNGHDVTVVTKDKDLTNVLLDGLGVPYLCLSGVRGSLLQMGLELAIRDWKIFRLHQQKNFDLAIGSSVSVSHLTALFDVYSLIFCEDDDDVVALFAWLSYPFATRVVNPQGLNCKRFLHKRLFHPSYQKLAYLHPDNFKPDSAVLQKYGLNTYDYVVIRCSAYQAYHDAGQSGFTEELLASIRQRLGSTKLVISVENEVSHCIDPLDMHHILAYSKLVICDSQSMSVESAMLATPSLRLSSFVGRIAILNELENKYELTKGFEPQDGDAFLRALDDLLANDNLHLEWEERRSRMLLDKVDFNAWMIQLFESLRREILS